MSTTEAEAKNAGRRVLTGKRPFTVARESLKDETQGLRLPQQFDVDLAEMEQLEVMAITGSIASAGKHYCSHALLINEVYALYD